MSCLGDIKFLADWIKAASTKVIKAFHKLIFENEGGRKNRNRLRNLSGFDFEKNSTEYKKKIEYTKSNFQVNEFTSIGPFLRLDNDGILEELVDKICTALIDISILSGDGNETESDDDDDLVSQSNQNAGKGKCIENSNTNDNESVISQYDQSVVTEELSETSSKQCEVVTQPLYVSFRDVEGEVRTFKGTDAYIQRKNG